jgi:hypothetical protein
MSRRVCRSCGATDREADIPLRKVVCTDCARTVPGERERLAAAALRIRREGIVTRMRLAGVRRMRERIGQRDMFDAR